MDVTDAALKETFGLMRTQAEGASAKVSNIFWKTVGQVVEPKARTALAQLEPFFVAAGEVGLAQLAAWFEKHVRPIVFDLLAEELQGAEKAAGRLELVIRRRCEFAAQHCLWKGAKRRSCRRGRDRDVFFGNESAKERRQVSSKGTGEHRTFVATWELLKLLTPILKDGKAKTKAEIVKEASGIVSQSFVYKHFDRIIAELGLVFRDGAYRFIVSIPSRSQVTTQAQSQAVVQPKLAVILSIIGRPTLKNSPEAESGPTDHQNADRSTPEPALELT
ncbi:hypothetical protein [Bradyrhizobium sp. RT9b]|uniref:hypothetical protein n=1 Tax=unclassified Bradyrhizobium TaxID=2631580 RepID=UPI003398FA75